MRHGDRAATERSHKFCLVVAGHGERGAVGDHAHHESQHAWRVGSAVHEVAKEDGPTLCRVRGRRRPSLVVASDNPAKGRQQLLEFGAATVHVADHVEWAVFVAQIVEELGANDLDIVELVTLHGVDVTDALTSKALDASLHRCRLAPHNLGAKVAVRASLGAGDALRERGVDDDGDRQHVVRLGEVHKFAAGSGLDARRVDYGDLAAVEPLASDELEHVKRIRRRRLVVLIVGDKPTRHVGTDDLGGEKVLAREGRLARSRDADEHHQGQFGDLDAARHSCAPVVAACSRVKMAIWVGWPSDSCSSPTPSMRNAYPCAAATPCAQSLNSARVSSQRWSG